MRTAWCSISIAGWRCRARATSLSAPETGCPSPRLNSCCPGGQSQLELKPVTDVAAKGTTAKLDARKSGTFKVGGDILIHRLGFGAMRITGPSIWGPPADRAEALRSLRRLPELGIDFVDTANSYGPDVSEELIKEAL